MADIDFNSMTRAELIELRSQLDKAIASVGQRDRQRALEAAEAIAREHGFALSDLAPQGGKGAKGRGMSKRAGRSGASSSPAPSDAKYRNPENPDQTWSGRGRRPRWVHEATASGRSLADLEIR